MKQVLDEQRQWLHFNLKQVHDAERLTQIMLTTTVNRRRIRIYIKLRVEPRYWDKKTLRCNTSLAPNRREQMRLTRINEQIDTLVANLHLVDEKLAKEGKYLSPAAVRKVIEEVQLATHADISPMESLYKLVEEYTQSINRRGKRGIESTSQTYLVALKRIENYCIQRKVQLDTFDDFDKIFFIDFTNYLYTCTFQKGDKVLNYTQNTVINTLKVVKNLLHKAYDNDLTDNNYFMKVQTTLPAEVTEQIYLQESEIQQLAAMPLTGQEKIVRDMFVISCYTALRISDMLKLDKATIHDKTISTYQTKTKAKVQIPILKEIVPLVEHYRKNGFPTFNIKQANLIVKELARRCGINEIISYKENRGGIVSIKQQPKWQRITFHTARRSCITNLFRRGYPINYIMSISGHSSIQACQRYIRASAAEVLEDFVNLLEKEDAL